MEKKDNFYIGWMPDASDSTTKFIRKVVIGLVMFMIIAGIFISRSQKKFSTAVFEYGNTVELQGLYQDFPVPSIRLASMNDITGKRTYTTIPLVGYGKHGAEGIIAELEKKQGDKFSNKELTLRGTLIYHDGKSLLQIDQNDSPFIKLNPAPYNKYSQVTLQTKGKQTFCGEIVDPKCFFGVMKPGLGKPHRDCAIRCLAGGIPPVFVSQDETGNKTYYLLRSADGKKIDPSVLQEIIADPVSFSGELKYFDDWGIIYLKQEPDIKRVITVALGKTDVIRCEPGE